VAQTATIQAGPTAESYAAPIKFVTPEETMAAGRNVCRQDVSGGAGRESGGELMFVGDDVPLGGVGMGPHESDVEVSGCPANAEIDLASLRGIQPREGWKIKENSRCTPSTFIGVKVIS